MIKYNKGDGSAHAILIGGILLFMAVVIYFAGALEYTEYTTESFGHQAVFTLSDFKAVNIITSFQYNPLIDIFFTILLAVLALEIVLIVRGI